MTKEKLEKANDLFVYINEVEGRYNSLVELMEKRGMVYITSNQNCITSVDEDERWVLGQLLEYRMNKLIALKKEFELL
jgi:hypothetical protein